MIPARWGSTRLPGKVLAYIGGQTMLERVWASAVSAACFDRVVIATDDARVMRVAHGFGASVARTGDARSGTARAALVVPDEQAVVVIQADQPFLARATLQTLADAVRPDCVSTLATPYLGDPDDPALVKVWVRDGWATGFSRVPEYPGYLRHIGLYGFGAGVLTHCVQQAPSPRSEAQQLEQCAWFDAGIAVRVAEVPDASMAVDTPGQLLAARAHTWS